MGSSTVPKAVKRGVSNMPCFTPAHIADPGVPFAPTASTLTLFTPLKIRSKRLCSRIIVAPMCQYSTAGSGPDTGKLTDYHIATLGHYALKGAGFSFYRGDC